MKKLILVNVKKDLQEQLKDKEFRKLYEKEKIKVALAQKIAVMREEENIKQSELAKRMHVSQQFVSQIETGEQNNLTIDTLMKIAKSFNRGLKISFPKVSKRDEYPIIE